MTQLSPNDIRMLAVNDGDYNSTFELIKDFWERGWTRWEIILLQRNAGWPIAEDMIGYHTPMELMLSVIGCHADEEAFLDMVNTTFNELKTEERQWAEDFVTSTNWGE